MKRTLYTLLAAPLGGLVLAACDAAPPQESTDHQPAESSEAAASAELEEPALPLPEDPEPLDPAVAAAAEAIADAMGEGDAFARARRLGELLPSLGPEGAHGAEEALRAPGWQPVRGGAEIELLARFWATHEPLEASRWAVTEAPTSYSLSAIFPAVSTWAAADPQAALVAVQTWENLPDVRELVQIALVHGWFERDPVELARYLQQHEMGMARQRKLSNYMRLLILHQGVEAASSWAESLSDDDGRFKQHAYRQLVSALTAQDLEAALRFCEAHCDGPYGTDLPYVIAMGWARRPDGLAAVDWLAARPEGSVRNTALMNSFFVWAKTNPNEAWDWMNARIPGSNGEPEPWVKLLIPRFALVVMRSRSHAEALEWALRVENESEREQLLIRIARAWRAHDKAASEAWLSQSPLSEEARESSRRHPRREDLPKQPAAPPPST